ncbi:MAG TPA: trimeric intracellular cation channel family protein [Ktedonosporobacter sp.]|nr:trimeric intracellular cation channel family protein [Ktedonosporobacter sp.]
MLLYILDLCGVAVFAISGVLAAGRRKMDILGVFVIALVTAIGGGTLRDVLIGRHPIFWFRDTTYLLVIVVAAIVTMLYTRFFHPPHKLLLVADALGLALFTMSGARIAQEAGLPGIIVILMATSTAVAGGIVRDILCAQIPLVLQKDIYMTAVLVGASAYVVLPALGLDSTLASLIAMALVIALRLAAIYWHLDLPRYYLKEK